MDFPALWASYCWLLGILIGSSCSVLLLWLVAATTLVLVFQQSSALSITALLACVCLKMFAHLPFRTLTRLMDISTDPIILAVAAHDTGEYVRHYPRGKQWVFQPRSRGPFFLSRERTLGTRLWVFRKYRYFRVSKNLNNETGIWQITRITSQSSFCIPLYSRTPWDPWVLNWASFPT